MGLFDYLRVNPGRGIDPHEEAGRFIPITQIHNSEQLQDAEGMEGSEGSSASASEKKNNKFIYEIALKDPSIPSDPSGASGREADETARADSVCFRFRAPLRQRVTKGAGSRQKGLLMAFKLLRMAQERWWRIDGAHVIPLVRGRVGFIDGAQAERRSAA
jgi:hypothetical protein